MKSLLSALRRSFYRGVVIAFVGLLSWVGMTVFSVAPSFAADTNDQPGREAVISPDSQTYGSREEAYEKATKALNDPEGVEKEYEKDLKIFKKENPDKSSLVEGAKDAVKKVTGQDS
jgi:hypothetical protein